MRVVLDTNILIRAAKGAPSPAWEVLQRVTSDPHVLIISHFILTELVRVLDYPHIRTLHKLTPLQCSTFVGSVDALAEHVDLNTDAPSKGLSSDPDDEPIVQTAVVGRANVLCTLDRHLHNASVVSHCDAHGIRILTDVELLKLLRASEETAPGDKGTEGLSE